MNMTTLSVFDQIRALLDNNGARYRTVTHAPTFTCEESAAARGEEMKIGGKALLMKADEDFILMVLAADQKLDSKKVKQLLACKKLRFASKEELLDATTLVPGSVPPFGQPVFKFPLHVDAALLENTKIAFNAGSLTNSIILDMEDYKRIARPLVSTFTAQ